MDYSTDIDMLMDEFANATATIGTTPIPVLFDAPYQGVNPQTLEIESYAPAATLQSATVAAHEIGHGTEIGISGTPVGEFDGDYTVIGVQPDGQGLVKLLLERQ
ncbi:MAG: hypothetical protein EHM79_02260 [Geobacter sp.]|nr:MAG: hypothetical protein EHM79_02260 [Geobacter sp.]